MNDTPDTQIVTVHVSLPGREYPIDIGPGALERLGPRLRERSTADRCTVITDANVGPLHWEPAQVSLEGAGFSTHLITVPAGDETKSLETAGEIYDELAQRRHARNEPILALGGGMVGDLAGFVAGTWLRGVPFVQCSTTTEADIDAGVGGKTAVNRPTGKNLVGVFHQPRLVCMDTNCLSTLTERDFRAGLAESIKHAVVRDPGFLEWHDANAERILAKEPETLRELIRRNCINKADVVIADERELDDTGVGRAALNLGHTIGHAIESQLDYRLRHGEAVSLGLVAAMDMAVRLCGMPDEQRQQVERSLARLELPIRSPEVLDVEDILHRLGTDKKVRGQMLRFVLPRAIGDVCWFTSPSEEEIRRAIDRVMGA